MGEFRRLDGVGSNLTGSFGLLGVGSAPDISGENWYFVRMNSSSIGSNA